MVRREVTLWPLGSSAGGERQRLPPSLAHAGEHPTSRWGWGWGSLKRVVVDGVACLTAVVLNQHLHSPTQRPCSRPHRQPRVLRSHPLAVHPLIDGVGPTGS